MKKDNRLIFGIYPFSPIGMAGSATIGKPDDFAKIGQAIMDLKGGANNFLIRSYVHYTDEKSAETVLNQIGQLLQIELQWDFALCFRSQDGKIGGWLDLIREIVARYGNRLNTLQITNEPNLKNIPGAGDSSSPNVRQALIEGVRTAREKIKERGASVSIGFNAVPTFDASDDFWRELKLSGGQEFAAVFFVREAIDRVKHRFRDRAFVGTIVF